MCALFLQGVIEREYDGASGLGDEPQAIEPRQQDTASRRRALDLEPGRSTDHHAPSRLLDESRIEAFAFGLPIVIEDRIVAPRRGGRLSKASEALELTIAIDPPIVSAQEKPTAPS